MNKRYGMVNCHICFLFAVLFITVNFVQSVPVENEIYYGSSY